VTDADLVLGYLDPDAVFGTSAERQIQPNRDLAVEAVRKVAEPLGLSVEDAALGIVEIVNARMANALERVVVGRGFDPRDFTVLSYGGSGPVHAAGYARELGVERVFIPGEIASVWSAVGIALSDIRYQRERDTQLVSPFDPDELERLYGALEAALRDEVAGGNGAVPEFRRYARIRYEWQRHELDIEVPAGLDAGRLGEVVKTFERTYESRYGSAALLPEARHEIVSLRLEAVIATGVEARSHTRIVEEQLEKPARTAHFERGKPGIETPVYRGRAIHRGQEITGPAIIDLPTTGIVVPPGTTVTGSGGGNFTMTFGG
jgi:N-methylhydantoinase A